MLGELDLLDGRVVDALSEGDWLVAGPVIGVLLLGLILGFVSWLKGRKLVAMLVWALLGTAVALMVTPIETVQQLVSADTDELNYSLLGMFGVAVTFGLITAVRLARPPSWWAQRRYDNDRYAEAIERHHWTRPQAR